MTQPHSVASLSYEHGVGGRGLVDLTVARACDVTTERYPGGTAIVSRHQETRLTYADLTSYSRGIAKGLIATGVMPGDRVGVLSPNCFEWAVLQQAIASAGAVLVALNPQYAASELSDIITRCQLHTLVSAQTFLRYDCVSTLKEAIALLNTCDGLGSAGTTKPPRLIAMGEGTSEESLTDLIEIGSSVADEAIERRHCESECDDPAYILFTSGTTGGLKGAVLTHHAVVNCALSIGDRLRLTSHDKICIPVPYHHCFGSIMGNLVAVTHGSAVVLPSDTFEPKACLEAVERERCTVLYGVPSMFECLLKQQRVNRFTLSSLRTGIIAGAPHTSELIERITTDLHIPEVTICYGMTETPPITQSLCTDSVHDRVKTVGSILPHVECKVVDLESGRIVPRGAQGELCARSYAVMRGYWGDCENTKSIIDMNRWIHTGDIGIMRDDGQISIVGRLKDIVIRGGENIAPFEIESMLMTHPDIVEAHVVSVPDDTYGEELFAWIRCEAGSEVTTDEVLQYVRRTVSTMKWPKYVRRIDAFPMTSTGKVKKTVLREMAASEVMWRRNTDASRHRC